MTWTGLACSSVAAWLLLGAGLACSGGDDTAAGDTAADGNLPDDPPWCQDPVEAVTYTEASARWGLIDTTSDDPVWRETNPVAIFDVDGDGDDDLVFGDAEQGLWLYRRSGDQVEASQVSDALELGTIGLGDVDADGDLDMVVAGRQPGMIAFLNDGDGGFTDHTAELGLDGLWLDIETRDITFMDMDEDGDLDITVVTANSGQDPEDFFRVYLNDGTGHFVEDPDLIPEESRSGQGWQALWLDLEGDEDQDLFFVNAEHQLIGPSHLLRNDGGGRYTEITDDCSCGTGWSNMGGSAGDFDGDGLMDVYLTNVGPSVLLWNQGDGSFVDATLSMGVGASPTNKHMTLSSVFFDRDNDADLDLMVTAGPFWEHPVSTQVEEQPDFLYERQESGFVDVAPDLGLDHTGTGRGIGVGFLNDDGFPDLVINHRGSPSQVWLSSCTTARSLVVELSAPAPNTFGVGAVLTLETDQGIQTRLIDSRLGWASAAQPRAHFGLGDSTVQRLSVRWPDGTVQDVPLPAHPDGRYLVIQE